MEGAAEMAGPAPWRGSLSTTARSEHPRLSPLSPPIKTYVPNLIFRLLTTVLCRGPYANLHSLELQTGNQTGLTPLNSHSMNTALQFGWKSI